MDKIERNYFMTVNPEGKCLYLGCGSKHLDRFINIDINPKLKPDIVRDVEKGLPFDDNSIDMIYSTHFMEHINPDAIDFVMYEIWRVLKPNGSFHCTVPINKSLFASPYHKSFWNEFTPIFFTEWNNKEVTGYEFKLNNKETMPKTNEYSDQFYFELKTIKSPIINISEKKRLLNLGSGNRKLPQNEGWINIDYDESMRPDIIRDLDNGLPFDTNSVSGIHASHVIEHVKDVFYFMYEIWRVCKPDTVVEIIAPNHASPTSIYPNHLRFIRPNYFEFWVPRELYCNPVMNCYKETMGAEFISLQETVIENGTAIRFLIQVIKEGSKAKDKLKEEEKKIKEEISVIEEAKKRVKEQSKIENKEEIK